ncbi:hypothetical protein ACQPYK_44740 [Streptosporangium sp. CA-135522]|uniref:hypothetical protein n=1 Tax=Streptosporangium sp. CA-135522 TaxID=3240072 RepID=UPI003D8C4725
MPARHATQPSPDSPAVPATAVPATAVPATAVPATAASATAASATAASATAAPANVRTASALWFIAVGAGVFEAALAVTGLLADGSASLSGLAGSLGIRAGIFALAIFMAVRLRQGRNWARVALTLLLGVFGTLSLVIEPVRWLLEGNSIGQFLADADVMTLAFTASRIVHLTAVLSAVALMFSSASNAYFRSVSRASRGI